MQVHSSEVNNYTLELTDISGKILQTKTDSLSPRINQIIVDVSEYTSGVSIHCSSISISMLSQRSEGTSSKLLTSPGLDLILHCCGQINT